MGRVVAVVNQKGGVGKTTLAVTLASAWALEGRRALLVDMDPQGSALDWHAARHAAPILDALAPPAGGARALLEWLGRMGEAYDAVVIDGPPRLDGMATRAALASSAFALVPVLPSTFDVWASAGTVELIGEARAAANPGLIAAFVLNRVPARAGIARDAREALSALGLPVLDAALGQRVAYAEAAATGRSVIETDRKAGAEARALAREIDGLTGVTA